MCIGRGTCILREPGVGGETTTAHGNLSKHPLEEDVPNLRKPGLDHQGIYQKLQRALCTVKLV